jgi:hypothetical protein
MKSDNRRTLLFWINAVAVVAWSIFFSEMAHAEIVKPTWDKPMVQIRMHWGSKGTVIQKCSEIGAWGPGVTPHVNHPIGCNEFHTDTNTCDIFAERPQEVDDERTRILGHELEHCLLGEYHNQEAL